MNNFKIEYEPEYITSKYVVYRKEYKCLGFFHIWKRITAFESLDIAQTELKELQKFPKYYELGNGK